ncbi:MAG: lysophospholipid acyltransferase family protein [Enterobacteriaceae bacterium]
MRRLFAAVNRLWRLAMTALCFILFGMGGVLLSLVWFNLLLLVIRHRERRTRIARHSICLSFRLFIFIARTLGVFDVHIEGKERLQRDQGCLLIANHPTLLDYVLLASVVPQTDCLVKSTLLSNPFVSGVIRAADYLINSQGETLLAVCQQRLTQGETLLIFPEGTRTPASGDIVLQRGAANIAVRCDCDVRVVTIHCSERMLDKTSHWYDIPPAKPLFYIEVGEKVAVNAFNAQPLPTLAARQLNRHLLPLLYPKKTFLSEIHNG